MKYLKKINESVEDKKITFVSGDDWEGIYLNGKLIDEGHYPDLSQVLKKLGYEINSIYIEQEEIWDEFGNTCPSNLEQVESIIAAKKYNL